MASASDLSAKQAEDGQVKILLQVFWLDAFRRQEGGRKMLSGRERYIFPLSNTFFFSFSFPVRDIRGLVDVCARRPVSGRADWQGCGAECRASSGPRCVIIASHAVSLTDVPRRGRPVTQKQSQESDGITVEERERAHEQESRRTRPGPAETSQ